MKIIISKSQWEEIGKTANWIKTAKKVTVDYYSSMFDPEKKRTTIDISPEQLEKYGDLKNAALNVLTLRLRKQKRLELDAQGKINEPVKIETPVIDKAIVQSTVPKKTGPNQKEQAHLRGIERQKKWDAAKREKERKREEREKKNPQKYLEKIKREIEENKAKEIEESGGIVNALQQKKAPEAKKEVPDLHEKIQEMTKTPQTSNTPDIAEILRKKREEEAQSSSKDLNELINKLDLKEKERLLEHTTARITKEQWIRIGRKTGWFKD